jgi:hypothetical protein
MLFSTKKAASSVSTNSMAAFVVTWHTADVFFLSTISVFVNCANERDRCVNLFVLSTKFGRCGKVNFMGFVKSPKMGQVL